MKTPRGFSAIVVILFTFPLPRLSLAATASAASSEMERLAQTLVGDWSTVETMERSPEFPNGGSRRGSVAAHLAAGGTTLIYEVHSDGSAGKLDGFLLIWWEQSSRLYAVFACFNSPRHPCRMRGTARWENDVFVNDYETSDGPKTRWRDSFHFTPTSHTLLAAMDAGDGTMKTLITTRATRR